MRYIQSKILDWANDKDLLHFKNRFKQLDKVLEEVEEVRAELVLDNKKDLALEIGDVGVTMIILAKQNGLDFQKCIKDAYNKIKNRTGKTINGTFVKDAN